jgi:thiamine kinase-like enzyme
MKENETSGCRSLCLIDYEYCAYNYRGFDLANHFIEWTYDYTNPLYPHYSVNRDQFPTKDQQVNNIINVLFKFKFNTSIIIFIILD